MRGETAAACRLRVSARKDGRNLWLFVKNAEHRSPKTAPSAQLAAPQSKYAAFHSRQALKLDIVSTLLLIVSAVLAFTFIVPIAGAVCIAILFVVRIICFFQVCSGKAKDAAIIGKLPFLK